MGAPMTDGRYLSGASAIGKALGVSRATVTRMIKDGRLPTFRTGEKTSPHKVERKQLEALRRGK